MLLISAAVDRNKAATGGRFRHAQAPKTLRRLRLGNFLERIYHASYVRCAYFIVGSVRIAYLTN